MQNTTKTMNATEKISCFVYAEKSAEWEQIKCDEQQKKNWLEKWTTLKVLGLGLALATFAILLRNHVCACKDIFRMPAFYPKKSPFTKQRRTEMCFLCVFDLNDPPPPPLSWIIKLIKIQIYECCEFI